MDLSEDENPSDTSSDINKPTNNSKNDVTKKEDKYEVLNADYTIWTNSIGQRLIKFSIPVKNIGETDLHLRSMTCDIESNDGKLLQTVSYITGYPSFIKPGETGYYYDSTSCDFTDDEVNIIPHANVEHASVKMIRYDVSDVSILRMIFGILKL